MLLNNLLAKEEIKREIKNTLKEAKVERQHTKMHGVHQKQFQEGSLVINTCIKKKVKLKALVTQLCPTLCESVDWNPPGSSVHGILQARILGWTAISFSRGSSQPRH